MASVRGMGRMGRGMRTAVFQRSGHHVLHLQKQCQGWLAGWSVTSGMPEIGRLLTGFLHSTS